MRWTCLTLKVMLHPGVPRLCNNQRRPPLDTDSKRHLVGCHSTTCLHHQQDNHRWSHQSHRSVLITKCYHLYSRIRIEQPLSTTTTVFNDHLFQRTFSSKTTLFNNHPLRRPPSSMTTVFNNHSL